MGDAAAVHSGGRRLIRSLAIFLALTLLHGPVYGGESVKESVSRWHLNRLIEVELNSGGKLPGHLGIVTDTGFTLEPIKRGDLRRDFKFTEVKAVHAKMATWKKWTITGVAVWGVLAIIGSRV